MTISQRYKLIQLADIDSKEVFVGYFWYSDEPKPKILNQAPFLPEFNNGSRFIVEGYLYNDKAETSYQIKDIDGKYHVAVIDLKGLDRDGENWDTKDYYTHDVAGFTKYTMIEAWTEADLYPSPWRNIAEKNIDLADKITLPKMETLVPAWSAFCGFK